MRLAYISFSTIPSLSANSIHVMKMCQALSQNGHEVLLIALYPKSTQILTDNPYEFYGVEPCFEIKKLPCPAIKGQLYLYGLLAAISVKKWQPDMVYGRFLPGTFFSSLLGFNVVFETHAPLENHGKLLEWMFQRLISGKRLKRIITISEALKQYYQQKYSLSPQQIIVAHDGADNATQQETANFANNNRLQVGYVGQLYPGRGIEIILEIAKRCPWADFHLVGGTQSDIDLWKYRGKELSNITFHGFIPPYKTDLYRNSFDVLLAPYQQNVFSSPEKVIDTVRWMSPLKIFEYMSAEKAIICSDLPVLREILVHQQTALLCKPDDPKDWVNSLKYLRDNSNMNRQLALSAKQEFLAKYTWKERAKKILQDIE